MGYVKDKCGLYFVNEYINRICYLFDDWGLGCGEVLWISGKGVGFCYWEGLWISWRRLCGINWGCIGIVKGLF